MRGPFPLLVADCSFDDEPGGCRAFSYDGPNQHHDHPGAFPVGTLVWTRDLTEPTGSEYLAEVTKAIGEPLYWVYDLRPVEPRARAADLATALGCSVEDLLGAGGGGQ